MKPVHQDILDDQKGNCLSAAFASLLELPLELVPNFMKNEVEHDADWYDSVQKWLGTYGLYSLWILIPQDEAEDAFYPIPKAHAIAIGKSPRHEGYHCVVGEVEGTKFTMTHDPAPEGGGLAGPVKTLCFLVPISPAATR